MLRFSRPDTNEEVFEIAGPDDSVAELVRLVARSLPGYIQWEAHNERLEWLDTHAARWRCDLKPVGYVDENIGLAPERADNTTERNKTDGR